MSPTVVATRYGRPALDALRDVVRTAKAPDPMAPVTVLLPGNLAGVVARRHLATHGLTDDGPNAVAGVHLATLRHLAEQIAAGSLATARPAVGPVVAAAWRAALTPAQACSSRSRITPPRSAPWSRRIPSFATCPTTRSTPSPKRPR